VEKVDFIPKANSQEKLQIHNFPGLFKAVGSTSIVRVPPDVISLRLGAPKLYKLQLNKLNTLHPK
jgi:hypothetical protein